MCNRLLLALVTLSLCFAATSEVKNAEIKRDIEYGTADGVSLRMDAAIPNGPGPFPAAILVHGGGWIQGDKDSGFGPILQPLTDAGFAWFSINYRLASQYLYPVAHDDVKTAIRFLREHSEEYKIDPARIVLIGESAGAQLAGLAATTASPAEKVSAVVSFYGPTDLVDLARSRPLPGALAQIRDSLWGPIIEEQLRKLSPIQHISKDMPPFLFIHGTADRVVPYEQSVKMCELMHKAGAVCDVILIPGGSHGMTHWESHPSYKQEMIRWLKTWTAPPV